MTGSPIRSPSPRRPPSSAVATRASATPAPRRGASRSTSPAPRGPRIPQGHDEQVEPGRADEPADDDEGHRLLDLAAGAPAQQEERDERDAGGERGHEDGREPVRGAGHQRRPVERAAALPLEVEEVRDQDDAVADRDPEDGDEADDRTQGEPAAGAEEDGGEPAHEGE